MDLSAAVGTTLYAVENGTLGSLGTDSVRTTKFTIDTAKASNLVCHYVHVNSMSAPAYYYKGATVGQSGSYGTDAPHLHFGAHSTSGLSYRTEIVYRWLPTTNWNAAKDLDAYGNVQWNGGRTASIVAYYKQGSTPYGLQVPEQVYIYHRRAGNVAWEGGAAMTAGSNNTYTYNFTGKTYKNVTYKAGDTIEWTVRMKRTGISTAYTFAPAKFYKADPDPNFVGKAYDFWSNVYN